MLEPKKPEEKPAYILEFKVLNGRKEATPEDAAMAALAQIEEKKYANVLICEGER